MKLLMVMLVALVVVVMVLPSDVFSRSTKSLIWRMSRSSSRSTSEFNAKEITAVILTVKRKFPSMSFDDINQMMADLILDKFTFADTEEPDFILRLLESFGVDDAEYLEYYRAIRRFMDSPQVQQFGTMLLNQYGSFDNMPAEVVYSAMSTASVEELTSPDAAELLTARVNKAMG